jgi:hypothetical protein
LFRFNTGAPGTAVAVGVTSIGAGETKAAIDWRPQTGQLFGLGVNGTADNATLYRLDPQTGSGTAIGTPGQIAFVAGDGITPVDLPSPASVGYGMDFNPTVDRVRVVTDTGLNFRANPNNGAPIDGNSGATGIQTDTSINALPPTATGVTGAAYTNSFGQSLTGGVTTQYVLEPTSNMLFIQNPPNSGTLTAGQDVTVNGAELSFGAVNGFDIPAGTTVTTSNAPANGPAYAVLPSAPGIRLYRIALGSGAAIELGTVGSGEALAGLALGDGPPPQGPSGQPPGEPPEESTPSDGLAPVATITKGPKDKTKKKTATFEFTGTDARAVASFQCKLDAGAFTPCTSPHTVKVKPGKHTFQVQAIDQAGNVGAPATDAWKRKKKK